MFHMKRHFFCLRLRTALALRRFFRAAAFWCLDARSIAEFPQWDFVSTENSFHVINAAGDKDRNARQMEFVEHFTLHGGKVASGFQFDADREAIVEHQDVWHSRFETASSKPARCARAHGGPARRERRPYSRRHHHPIQELGHGPVQAEFGRALSLHALEWCAFHRLFLRTGPVCPPRRGDFRTPLPAMGRLRFMGYACAAHALRPAGVRGDAGHGLKDV